MNILHFADVHFHESTLKDLEAPCAEILELAAKRRPDAIVIAGDLTTERGIIDNATAVAVRNFVWSLADHAPVFVLAGNHDLTYREGQPNNLHAILADKFGNTRHKVSIVDRPCVLDGIAFLPYPSVPTFHAVTGSSDLGEVSDRLVDVVEGLKAELAGTDGPKILVYHGTVEGGRTGDEGAPGFRTRGTDIVLPTASLAGFDAVLCGHLHHPQAIPYHGGAAVYPGCVAPLTFGERTIQPRALEWHLFKKGEVLADDGRWMDSPGGWVKHDEHPLPVSHQRLQVEVSPDDWDESSDVTVNLRTWVGRAATDGHAFINARVKVKAVLPKPRLALITPETIDSVREAYNLDRLVVEKTEHEVSKLLLEDGQDRAARVDVVESLDRYADYVEDPAFREHIDAIRAVGREIEADIQSEHADPQYGFDPIELELVNYKQFADVTVRFDDLPQRTGVLGPTGIGKSNLLLAIVAALYGGNPKSEAGKAKASLASVVRRGESGGSIRLTFRTHGGTYRITRRFKVNGKGVGSGTLFLDQKDAKDWQSINGGTSRETQAEIDRLVGPEALHWLTRHLRQHGVSAVKMTSGDLADAINTTLQLDFDARATLARDKHALAERARDACRTRRETLSGQITPLAKIEQQEDHAKRLKRDAETNGVQDQKLIERMEAERDGLKTRQARYEHDLRTLGERKGQREKLQADIDAATEEARQLEAELDRIGDAPDADALETAAAESRDRSDAAQAELARLKDEGHALDLEDAQTCGALEASRQAAATKRQDASRKHEAAKRDLDAAARAWDLIERVPCRGEMWYGPNDEPMDGSACELLADAKARADELQTITQKVNDAAEALKAADQDHETAMQAVNSYKVEAQRAREERQAGVRVAADAAARAAEHAHGEAQRAKAARERAALRGAAVQRLAPIRERLSVLTNQLDGLPMNDGHYAEQKAAWVETGARIEALDKSLTERREALARSREQIGRCDADLEQMALERKQRDDMLAEIAACDQEEKEAERRRLALDYYRRAVGRDGIPSLLLEQLAPQLEARVNDILEPVGRSLKIDTARELVSGKTKTEVTLSFRSPSSGDVFVPIAELSGGEEDLANLALAAGLARVSADMSGTELGTVILDEPAAGVSESLQSETLEVLDRIGRHVQRSVIVTHRRDLAAACDAVLEISQNGAGSVVEVQS